MAKIKEHAKLPITIYESELNKFSEAEDKPIFIKEFIKQKERADKASESDIWSLFLRAAIASNKLEVVKFILSTFKDNNEITPVDLLTTEDRTNKSAISVALASFNTCDPEILQSIASYIQGYTGNYLKTSLDKEASKVLHDIFYYVIDNNNTSQNVSSYIETYLEPLYTSGNLQELYHTSNSND